MMFTRVAPLRLKFSLIGSRTFVARTISFLTPFKAFPTRVSLSPRLYTSAVSMKLIPLSKASFTMRVVSSWPRLPMFILPPNCIVPSATLLTMSPVFPSFLYFISTPLSTANEECDSDVRRPRPQMLRTQRQPSPHRSKYPFTRHFDRHLPEARLLTSVASHGFRFVGRDRLLHFLSPNISFHEPHSSSAYFDSKSLFRH